MKKLIITMMIATCTVMAFGNCSEPVSEPCAFAYRFKVMVRTTDTCSRTEGCGPCGESETLKFRKPAVRKFMGWIYGTTPQVEDGCSKCGDKLTCSCNEWSDVNIALFDYNTHLPVEIESAELIQLNRIGCADQDRNKAEMTFTVTTKCEDSAATMVFSGFGLCGKHNGSITLHSANGFCAGILPAGTVEGCGPCGELGCVSGNNIWNLCSNEYKESKTTSAYGKWTISWDESVVSKIGINLTDSEVKTSFGTASPVKFNDNRD